jgi:isoleucyl-tRNA synthetase
MRWQYSAQPPTQNLLFGFGPGHEIQRKLLTLWNSASFFVQYANIAGFTPSLDELEAGPAGELAHLDRWLVERTRLLVSEATDAYEAYLSVNVLRAFEEWVDDVSNWYVRRSRRRFWDGDAAALRTLWSCLATGLRVVAPVMPFLTEHLWDHLVAGPIPSAPRSIFLAGWPEVHAVDRELLDDEAAVRQVVELGRQARAASKLKIRQPLRRLVVEGLDRAKGHADDIGEELRVKDVEFGPIEATDLRVRPNLKVLGPRLGPQLGAVRAALDAGKWEALPGDGFRVAGHDLGPDDVLVERTDKPGWAVATADGVSVALDTELDDELRREGRVYDLIHHVNGLRKDAGLELTDRIRLTLPAADADLADHFGWIATETLAVAVEVGDGAEVALVRASA